MRKLFTLLILSLLVINSWGQTTVTIGTGTVNSYFYGPIYRSSAGSSFDYSKHNFLITAAEIAAAGIPSGGVISQLAWNKSTAFGTTGNAKFDIYMKNSALTTLVSGTTWSTVTAGATLVYTSTAQTIPAPAGWVVFTFSTPFTYSGGSIEIAVDWDCSMIAGSPSTGAFNWYYTSGLAFNGTIGWTNSTAGSGATTLATGSYGGTLRPNVQITFTGGTPCSGTPAPGNTVASANPTCPGASLTLSLQNSTPGSGVTYLWETAPDGGTWSATAGTSAAYATSQTVTTWYRCQVTCDGNTTASNPVEVTMNPFMNCYCPSAAGSTSDEDITKVMFGSTLNNTSACASLVGSQGTGTGTADLYTNFTSIPATTVQQTVTTPISVEVTECAGSAYSHDVRVYIDFNQNGSFSDAGEEFIIWPYASSNTHTINANILIPATATPGITGMRVVCKESSTTGPCVVGSWGETEDYLVNIDLAPACPNPAGQSTTGITNTEAILDWTPGGTEILWNILWGPAGFDPAHAGTLISGIAAHPYTLGGLSANTSYDWYVQADCGTSVSPFTGPKNFRTLCDPIPSTSLPWTENFDAMVTIGNNIVPDCWKATSPTGTPWTSGNAASVTQNDPCSAPNYVYVSYSPSLVDKFLITPGFSLKGGTSYDFKFNWVGDAIAGWTGDVWVNTTQSGTGATAMGTAFVVAATAPPATCAQVVRSYVAPANGVYYFMVRVNNTGSPWYLGFDDFIVEQSPACPDPNSLTAAPAGFQAVLGWASTASTFDIEWGATPYTFTGVANITGVSNPYTLTGLAPSTGYTYKVMADCGGGTYSGWSAEKTFTTTVACPAPTLLTATGITTTSADLGWTEPGSATLWNIEFGPAGFTPTGIPTHTGVTNPFNIGGLTSATSYAFYVQADCGGAGPSLWTGPKTFTTLCNAFPAPFLEQFTTWPPLCWDLTGGTYSWIQYSVGAVQCAKANFWSQTNPNTDIMTTPVIDVTAMANPTLKFDWSHSYSATYPLDGLDVKVSDDGGTTWTTVWTKVGAAFNSADGAGNTTPGTFVPSGSIDLTPFGNLLLIRFVGNSGYGPDAYVDNVEVFAPIAHDVLTSSVDMASLMGPGSVSPKATVKNNGSNTETFPVTMTIGAYTSTMTVTALAPGATQQVTFASWTATLGTHSVNVCTQLVGDLDPGNDCKGKVITVETLRKAYAYIAYDPTLSLPEGPAWFYVQTPGTITSLGATTSGQFIGAGTWANGVWYGSEYYDAVATPNGGGWWSIDPTTGAMTMIADINLGFAGIAYDKVAGIMYGANWNGTTNELYTINPLTGAFVLVGTFGGTDLMINLAADGSGFLWGVGLTTDHLFKIDPIALTVTDIGATGFALNYAQDMEYDYDKNIMYAAGYTTVGSLYTVNMTTGAFTLIGDFQGGSEVTGFAIPEIPVIPLSVTGVVTDVTCFGGVNGAIATTVVGGTAPYTYLWSNLATSASLTGLTAGSYSVTVTDAVMGTATGTWTVGTPAELVLTGVVTNATCPLVPDGAIDLSVTGGTGALTYLWSNGNTTQDISGVSYGSFTVTVTDANNCTKTGNWAIGVLDPVCNNSTVVGTLTGTSCFDAHITITVVGVTVTAPLGNVTFIAGQNILFQPGVVVQSGAYMHGYISNIFCSPTDLPAATTAGQEEGLTSLSNANFTLYPNPTNGNFTLVQKRDAAYGNVKVEVFNMSGSKVMTERMTGEKKHEFSFSAIPAGVYFVKIVADEYVETIKLIKTR